MDIHTALKSYTIRTAHQMFLDTKVGSLEVGKDADIAVWDRNMYTVVPAALKDLRCEMTIVAGKVAFTRGPPSDPGLTQLHFSRNFMPSRRTLTLTLPAATCPGVDSPTDVLRETRDCRSASPVIITSESTAAPALVPPTTAPAA